MLGNYILEGSNAPGSNSAVLLTGAKPGRVTWRSQFVDGARAFYFITDGNFAEWGICTVHWGTPDTITRDTVFKNTLNTTNRINFTSAVDVYNELPAPNVPYIDGGLLVLPARTRVDSNIGGTPVGSGMDFWGTAAPAGWLFANGAAVSRTTYSQLFAVIGTTYGVGDGSSTFNLPDKRGRVSAALDNMGGTASAARLSGVLNSVGLHQDGGSQWMHYHSHGLNWSDPGHAHNVADYGHGHGYLMTPLDYTFGGYSFTVGNPGSSNGSISAGNTFTAAAGANVGIYAAATGISASIQYNGAGDQQNVQPTIMCNYIIFAGV